jgi:hypothetical protein
MWTRRRAGNPVLLLLLGALAVAAGCGQDPTPETGAAPVVEVAPPGPTEPDAAGVPPLIPEGIELEPSEMGIDEYFERYGGVDALAPDADAIREDLAAEIEEQLVGKQVTWDGYVARIRDAPSGRVMLVVTRDREESPEAAMVRMSAAWSDYVHAIPEGTHVRVVGVFDKLIGVFPSLAASSIEPLP